MEMVGWVHAVLALKDFDESKVAHNLRRGSLLVVVLRT